MRLGRLRSMVLQLVRRCEEKEGNDRGKWSRGGLVYLRVGSFYEGE